MLKFFATCPLGLENLLFNELKDLNLQNVKETVSGVSFDGEMKDAMRACIWSRFASRILLVLSRFHCSTDSELYIGALGIAWEQYTDAKNTISVAFSGTNKELRNTQYSALKVKDAICDRLQKAYGARPDVDKHNSDIRIFANLQKNNEVVITLDLSGKPLHQRELHRGTGIAPLKENLAAAMVTRASFKEGNFIDPMCGSGTLLLEAASILTDTAPGLMRSHYGFLKMLSFDETTYKELQAEAQVRHNKGLAQAIENNYVIYGFDASEQMVSIALSNVKKAGFEKLIFVEQNSIYDLKNPFTNEHKVTLVTNPPYGQRMGNFNELISLYQTLGQRIKENFSNATAAIISTSKDLLSCMRLSYDRTYKLFNGSLECQLRIFEINDDKSLSNAKDKRVEVALDFANRLKKNIKALNNYVKRENIDCYRVYDADLPEYQAAIDKYNDYYIVQEYAAPSSIPKEVARRRVLDMLSATISVTNVRGSNVILKERQVQKGDSQYQGNEKKDIFMEVHEGIFKFKVNLEDYLDTGLFLDARNIRKLIYKEAKDKDFLNLFSYTSSVSVAAALGGAKSTVSVDMSKTYLSWAMDNFRLNSINLTKHDFIQADCLSYLSNKDNEKKFDLIYIDPPTFSNSKRMQQSFDVQRDHVQMLANLTYHLKDIGTVIFCTNKRGFKIEKGLLGDYGFSVEEITDKTIPFDFKQKNNIHKCFILNFLRSNLTKEVTPLVENTRAPKWSGSLSKKAFYEVNDSKDDFKKDINNHQKRDVKSFNKKEGHKIYGRHLNKDNNFNKNDGFKRKDRETKVFRKARVWGPAE